MFQKFPSLWCYQVDFQFLHNSSLGARWFLNNLGIVWRVVFPRNACVGVISKALSGDKSLLVLTSAWGLGRKNLDQRALLQNFQAEQGKLPETLICAGGFMLWGIRACWFLRSAPDIRHGIYTAWKNIPTMVKMLPGLAWLQAVRVLYSDIYISCWYLDIFTSTMFIYLFIYWFFYIKVDCRGFRLKEGCLRRGCVLCWLFLSCLDKSFGSGCSFVEPVSGLGSSHT